MINFTSICLLLVVAFLVASTNAFSSFTGTPLTATTVTNGKTMAMEYIPDGMTKAQWEKEKAKRSNAGKNLGKVGITTFKSRSFSDWQKSGGKNLFPVDPRKVKNAKELPYMQRPGGSSDDSDLDSKKGSFGGLFGGNKKKAAPEPVVEEKKTNWWTL